MASSTSGLLSEDDTSSDQYKSDIDWMPMNKEGEGPLPYRFEPKRRSRNEDDSVQSEEDCESESERVGNTDWLVLHLQIKMDRH